MFTKTQAMMILYIAVIVGWLYGNVALAVAGVFLLLIESLTDVEEEDDRQD